MMQAIKQDVAEELRPIFYREMPGRFIIGGMFRSFVAGNVARRAQRDFPVDIGKGIPQEDVPKIFSLFYSTKKHRIGMGLPVVKQIIEEHKGDIEVESELNKGRSFRLVFPIRWSEQDLAGK